MLLILWLPICWRCYFVVGLFIVGGAHFVVVALVYFGCALLGVVLRCLMAWLFMVVFVWVVCGLVLMVCFC